MIWSIALAMLLAWFVIAVLCPLALWGLVWIFIGWLDRKEADRLQHQETGQRRSWGIWERLFRW